MTVDAVSRLGTNAIMGPHSANERSTIVSPHVTPGKRAALVVAFVGVAIAVASCRSEVARDEGARLAIGRQADTSDGPPPRSRRVCQLVGEYDYSAIRPALTINPDGTLKRPVTTSQTGTSAHVEGTDLGYPVVKRDEVYFFFGDVYPSPSKALLGVDAVGQTSATLPSDECPKLDMEVDANSMFKPVTLDGQFLHAFATPTGMVYDEANARFIGGLTRPRSVLGAPPFNLGAALATAPDDSPTTFKSLPGVLTDRSKFLFLVPAIVKASQVPSFPAATSPDDPILLVWGAGQPYRNSAIHLAAARLAEFKSPSSWWYFNPRGLRPWTTDSANATSVYWPVEPASAALQEGIRTDSKNHDPITNGPIWPPNTEGCVDEFSVSYDRVSNEWLMLYVCASSLYPQGVGPAAGDTVLLRRSPSPLGPWSAAIPLLIPEYDGTHAGGDPSFGLFIHQRNPRMYRDASGLHRIPEPCGREPAPLPTTCAKDQPGFRGYPSYCPLPAGEVIEDESNPNVGCCTDPNACCDLAYDTFNFNPNQEVTSVDPSKNCPPEAHFGEGSAFDGAPYASYLVPSFTKALESDQATGLPTKRRLYYVLSTFNPYTVDLMASDLDDDDIDFDGIPNASDNCKTVFNHSQSNCNEEAENAWNTKHPDQKVPLLGDACDPVPCPQSDPMLRGTTSISTSPCKPTPLEPTNCSVREIRDTFTLRPLGSSPTEAVRRAFADSVGTNLPVGNVSTYARFCQDSGTPDFDCMDPFKQGDNELTAWSSRSAETRTKDHLWHRVTLENCARGAFGVATCLRPEPIGPEGFIDIAYGSAETDVRWKYLDDDAFWRPTPDPTKWLIPPGTEANCTNTTLFSPGTCLSGRMWLHGETLIGADAEHQTVGSATVGVHGKELANHNFDAVPDIPVPRFYDGVHAPILFFLVRTLPDPAPFYRFFEGAALPIIQRGTAPYAVFDDGHQESIAALVSDAVRPQLFDPELRLLTAVEPSPFAGGPEAPMSVVLSADATRLEGSIFSASDGTLVNGLFVGDSSSLRLASMPSDAPPARTGFAGVYSAARRRIVVVGGHDATGARLDDVWSYTLKDATWTKTPLPAGVLGEVIDATFSFRDGTLWVLDVDPSDVKHAQTRLLRIDLTTGGVETVVTPTSDRPTPPSPKYDRRGLEIDMDGNVVVYASSKEAQKHRIAVVTPTASGYDVRMTMRRARALALPPIVDLRGVALYFDDPKTPKQAPASPEDEPAPEGKQSQIAERLRALPLHDATLQQVEELLR